MNPTTNPKVGKIALYLLSAYIISLSLLQIWDLPVFGTKIQPPEFIFLLLIGWLIINVRQLPKFDSKIDLLTPYLFMYTIVVVVSTLFSKYNDAFFELLTLFYLLLMVQGVKYTLINFCDNIPTFVFRNFKYLGVFAALIGIFGWGMSQNGFDTVLVRSGDTYYPYFGFIGRVQGFTQTPGMYISIVSISILLLCTKMGFEKIEKWDFTALGLMLIAVVLTFSKSLILLIVGLLFLLRKWLVIKGKNIDLRFKYLLSLKSFLKPISILLVIFVYFATHFILISKENGQVPIEMSPYIQMENPILETENTSLYLCIYGHLKETAVAVGWQNQLIGVGYGQFMKTVPAMKKEGVYPAHFADADPHSTYFGAFAEMGWVGIYVVIAFFFNIMRQFFYLEDSRIKKYSTLLTGLSACFLIIILEGVFTDVLNFRHYWILFAVFWAMLRKYNLNLCS